MTSTITLAAASVALIFTLNSYAQDLKLGALLDRQPKRLSKADLDLLMPGANIFIRTQSKRWWDNRADGVFRAARDASGLASVGGSFIGEGTWHVNDRGQYSVDLAWDVNSKNPEKWCRFIYQDGDEYYASPAITNRDANAYRLYVKR